MRTGRVADVAITERMLRWAVRDVPVDWVRYLARLGGVLYLVTGVSLMPIFASAFSQLRLPEIYLVVALVAVASGVLALSFTSLASDALFERSYRWLAVALLFLAPFLVSVGLFAAGPGLWSTGSSAYLLAPVFGFCILRRSAALVLAAVSAVGFAVVLTAGPDVVSPAAQWLFLTSLCVSLAVLVGRLFERGERLAAAAQRAEAQLAEANTALAARVAEQGDEVERLGRLRRFLSPQVAEAVLATGPATALEPHRRLIATLCCDLRGFTRFVAASEPEEVVELIEAYYDVVVDLLDEFGATMGAFAGDGVTAFFGDPMPCSDPVGSAVELAGRLREPMEAVLAPWRDRGHVLGYGVGIAFGHATIGILGAKGRCDYTALGSVVNLASRLCDEAGPGEVIVDQRAYDALRGRHPGTLRWLQLKGLDAPVRAYVCGAPSERVAASTEPRARGAGSFSLATSSGG